MSISDPATCSTHRCEVQAGWVHAAWVSTLHYPGCDCCEVDGKIVPDGFSWSSGSFPGQTLECCEGKIVMVLQQSSNTTQTTSTTSSTPTSPSCKSAAELVDDSVMFIAGQETDVRVLRGDLQMNSLKSFPVQTYVPALTYHDGFVYLCGKLRFEEENICMKYSREEDEWTHIQNLPYINTGAEALSVNGNLYLFGGSHSGGNRNVLKYNSDENSWTVLPAKIPFDFFAGCSTIINDCRVLLIQFTGQYLAVFDAVSETFQLNSFPPIADSNTVDLARCAAVMGTMNNTVGVMVFLRRQKTFFFQLDPPGSGAWVPFSTNNVYYAPVLGRISENAMFLGGNPNGFKNEMLHNLSPSWTNIGFNISTYSRAKSTQVPKSWFQ